MIRRFPVCVLLTCLLGCSPKDSGPPPSSDRTPSISDHPQSESNTPEKTVEPTSEAEKIDALIEIVEKLDGAVFVRNDMEHDCREAAKHLRDKWNWKRKEIRTCRDFIRIAASGSSVSGRPYFIRFKDGREVRCGSFLLDELESLERLPHPPDNIPPAKTGKPD